MNRLITLLTRVRLRERGREAGGGLQGIGWRRRGEVANIEDTPCFIHHQSCLAPAMFTSGWACCCLMLQFSFLDTCPFRREPPRWPFPLITAFLCRWIWLQQTLSHRVISLMLGQSSIATETMSCSRARTVSHSRVSHHYSVLTHRQYSINVCMEE